MNHRPVALALTVFGVSAVVGCGTVKSVNLVPADSPCPNNYCGARMNEPVTYRVDGLDKCALVRLKFGDGSASEDSVDFGPSGATPWKVSHTYTGWPGPKTVTAEGVTNCTGTATQRVIALMPTGDPAQPLAGDFRVAFFAPRTPCAPVPSAPPLRQNSKVRVMTNPDPNVKVNFGCWFGGCIYDADGKPGSAAGGNFPFPGLREFSLVLRIGTQVVQGGTDTSFTVNQSGPLELCMNDDILADNTGAWGVFLFVDESSAP